jgi:hypothetical protein
VVVGSVRAFDGHVNDTSNASDGGKRVTCNKSRILSGGVLGERRTADGVNAWRMRMGRTVTGGEMFLQQGVNQRTSATSQRARASKLSDGV